MKIPSSSLQSTSSSINWRKDWSPSSKKVHKLDVHQTQLSYVLTMGDSIWRTSRGLATERSILPCWMKWGWHNPNAQKVIHRLWISRILGGVVSIAKQLQTLWLERSLQSRRSGQLIKVMFGSLLLRLVLLGRPIIKLIRLQLAKWRSRQSYVIT